MARTNKDSVNVKSGKEAVETVSGALAELRTDSTRLRSELNDSRAETNSYRAELNTIRAEAGEARTTVEFQHQQIKELVMVHAQELTEHRQLVAHCRERLERMAEAIRDLGGEIEQDDDARD
jgi:chromosome segregation ATPase